MQSHVGIEIKVDYNDASKRICGNNLVLTMELIINVNWPPYRDSNGDVSSVSPSSERIPVPRWLVYTINDGKKW